MNGRLPEPPDGPAGGPHYVAGGLSGPSLGRRYGRPRGQQYSGPYGGPQAGPGAPGAQPSPGPPPPRPPGPPSRPQSGTPQSQRIPLPGPARPSAQETQHERRRRRRAAREAQEETRVPSWGRDLLRTLGLAVFVQVFFGFTILLVRWRLLVGNDYEVIEAAQSWAELTFTINALMLMFVQLKMTRPDNGFRQSGLVPFALVSAVLTALIQLVALLVWPLLIGPDLVPGTVLAEVGSDSRALLTAAGLSLCVYSVFPAVCIPMMAGGWRCALACLVPFLGIILGGGYLATVVLDGYPSATGAVVWAGAAAVGLVLLTVSALIVLWIRRDDPHVHGTRTPGGGTPRRPTLEEIGWGPR